jgi:hypothetical protein
MSNRSSATQEAGRNSKRIARSVRFMELPLSSLVRRYCEEGTTTRSCLRHRGRIVGNCSPIPLGNSYPSLARSCDGIACACKKALFLCDEKVGRIAEREQDECEKGVLEIAGNGCN